MMNLTISRLLHFTLIVGVMALGAMPSQAVDRYVAQAGQTPDPVGGYTSWSGAASNIQYAVNAAAANETVWVEPGIYTCPTNGVVYNGITNVVYINKPLTLSSSNGMPGSVIIDGLGTNRGINVYYDKNTPDRFRLIGLIISNSYDHGILCNSALSRSWTNYVENCVITHGASGGGFYSDGGFGYRVGVVMSNTIIRNNPKRGVTVTSSGVTVGTPPPASELTDCIIENNADGGLSLHTGNHTLQRCIIRNNDSGASSGGGLSIGAGDISLYNCLIYGNSVNAVGGALYKWSAIGSLAIHNCTIVSNLSTSGGPGGIRSTSVATINNSILRFNYFNAGISDYYALTTTTFTNSCSTGTMGGTGNISTDPKFVDFTGHDFHLMKDSPCLNTGTNQPWMASAKDKDGNRRLDKLYEIVDMGCYEYRYEVGTTILVR